MLFQSDITYIFLKITAELGGFFILLLGFQWLIYTFYEIKRRKSFKKVKINDWDFKITKFLKGLTYLGFIIGTFSLLSGVGQIVLKICPFSLFSTQLNNNVNYYISVFLLTTGIITLFKPINDLPIMGIILFLISSLILFTITSLIPDDLAQVLELISKFSSKTFFMIFFSVIFIFISVSIRFYISILMSLSRWLSWPPLTLILTIFCIFQGFLIFFFGISLFS
ncbi:MAG: hypothetical protein ACTSVV_18500 [Promethearchaeota archaeon]